MIKIDLKKMILDIDSILIHLKKIKISSNATLSYHFGPREIYFSISKNRILFYSNGDLQKCTVNFDEKENNDTYIGIIRSYFLWLVGE